jgi:hypothetical protein
LLASPPELPSASPAHGSRLTGLRICFRGFPIIPVMSFVVNS